jgi:23S rRNA (cytidine1920-2'-O)/16S rRNA (cytidine1409-2'-O)-methyltransferase
LVTVDVSFISLAAIFPQIVQFMNPEALLIALFKPQFEVERKYAPKGVVKNQVVINEAMDRLLKCAALTGFSFSQKLPSQIKGPKGNQEIFLVFKLLNCRA